MSDVNKVIRFVMKLMRGLAWNLCDYETSQLVAILCFSPALYIWEYTAKCRHMLELDSNYSLHIRTDAQKQEDRRIKKIRTPNHIHMI